MPHRHRPRRTANFTARSETNFVPNIPVLPRAAARGNNAMFPFQLPLSPLGRASSKNSRRDLSRKLHLNREVDFNPLLPFVERVIPGVVLKRFGEFDDVIRISLWERMASQVNTRVQD